jgi:CubicO group peptidase (beta-lactamase class C family)
MQRFLKFSKITFISAIFIILILLTFNWEKINRLHSVITLFNSELIVDNFSNMNKAFITQSVQKSEQTFKFETALKPLPNTFSYREKSTSVDEFITRRATTALLVLKDDQITYESYFLDTQPTDKRVSWSMAKSFVSILFGMQVDEGKIDIEKSVDFYLPEMKGSGYENVKVKHVLQMSSGVKWDEDYQDFNSDINKMGRVLAIGGSLDEMTAELEAESEPGKKFHYVSMDTHVIGMIVRRVSGKSLALLLQENIWQKLGMESDADWIIDSQGAAFALGGLNVTTRDYARFGRLLVNNGQWQHEQLVSPDWIKAATTANAEYLKSTKDKLGYGYQIWLPTLAEEGEFFCVGVYGQYIYVNQKENVVIVKNSADKQFQDKLNSKQETMAFFREIVNSLK